MFYFYIVLADSSTSLKPIKIKKEIQNKTVKEAGDNEPLNTTISDNFQTNPEMFQSISSMYKMYSKKHLLFIILYKQ